jgi:hypothetical protein
MPYLYSVPIQLPVTDSLTPRPLPLPLSHYEPNRTDSNSAPAQLCPILTGVLPGTQYLLARPGWCRLDDLLQPALVSRREQPGNVPLELVARLDDVQIAPGKPFRVEYL